MSAGCRSIAAGARDRHGYDLMKGRSAGRIGGLATHTNLSDAPRARARIHVNIERMVGNWLTAADIKPS
jgi:hypothetical protein